MLVSSEWIYMQQTETLDLFYLDPWAEYKHQIRVFRAHGSGNPSEEQGWHHDSQLNDTYQSLQYPISRRLYKVLGT